MKTVESKLPSRIAAEQARTALKALGALGRRRARALQLRPEGTGEVVTVTVPYEAYGLFLEVLGQMADGNAVTVVPTHAELTTQQVADLLNVSRPFVVRLLDEGRLPSRKVGSHRRVVAADVLAYRQRDDRRRRQLLDELTTEAEKHGLGY